jgi:hypothetical protein
MASVRRLPLEIGKCQWRVDLYYHGITRSFGKAIIPNVYRLPTAWTLQGDCHHSWPNLQSLLRSHHVPSMLAQTLLCAETWRHAPSRSLPTFRRNAVPPSSVSTSKPSQQSINIELAACLLTLRLRIPQKCQWTSTRQHDMTYRTIVLFICFPYTKLWMIDNVIISDSVSDCAFWTGSSSNIFLETPWS